MLKIREFSICSILVLLSLTVYTSEIDSAICFVHSVIFMCLIFPIISLSLNLYIHLL